MARNVNTSLDLLRSSLGNISTALTGKGVSGTNKLSEVASRIRGIEIVKYASIRATVKVSRIGISYPIELRQVITQTNSQIIQTLYGTPQSSGYIYVTFENVPLGKTYNVGIFNYYNNGKTYYGYESVSVKDPQEYKVSVTTSSWDPPNPEEPWFDGMMLEDSEVEVEIN